MAKSVRGHGRNVLPGQLSWRLVMADSIPFILQKPSSHFTGATASLNCDQMNARPRVHDTHSHNCVDAEAGTGL